MEAVVVAMNTVITEEVLLINTKVVAEVTTISVIAGAIRAMIANPLASTWDMAEPTPNTSNNRIITTTTTDVDTVGDPLWRQSWRTPYQYPPSRKTRMGY